MYNVHVYTCMYFLQNNEYVNMNEGVKEEGKNGTTGYMNMNGSVEEEGKYIATGEPSAYLVSDRHVHHEQKAFEYCLHLVYLLPPISIRTQCL